MENVTTKLPARTDFPPELTVSSPWPTVAAIAMDWAIIVGSIWLAERFSNPATFLFAVFMVGSRQHAFFLIMHEGAHSLISKNRHWNDKISNFFAAWPVGFSTEKYRLRHWIHHRYVNTDKDPDWTRKRDDVTWQFPKTKLVYWKDTLAHLLGKGVLEMIFALRGLGLAKSDLPLAVPYFGVVAAALTLLGGWRLFGLYWAVPYFTVLPLLHRIRNSSEHLGLPKTHVLNGTRNVVGSPLETFLLCPHNGAMHLVHHVYPFIPWYRLKAARAFLLTNEEYRAYAHENDSYFLPLGRSMYRDMLRPPQTAIAETTKRAA